MVSLVRELLPRHGDQITSVNEEDKQVSRGCSAFSQVHGMALATKVNVETFAKKFRIVFVKIRIYGIRSIKNTGRCCGIY